MGILLPVVRFLPLLAPILLLGAVCQQLYPPVPTSLAGRDVFILAGQSNMVGKSLQDRWNYPHGQTLVYEPSRSPNYPVWGYAKDPFIHEAPDSGWVYNSAWPKFCDLWVQSGRKPVLIATATGGSTLATDTKRWHPDSNDLYPRITTYYAAVPQDGNLKAVLWLQGESDSDNWKNAGTPVATRYALYKQALFDLADAIDTDLGVPLVVAPVSTAECLWTTADCVGAPETPDAARVPLNDASVDAAAEHANILLGPNTDDIRHGASPVFHLHDVTTLGERWYAAVAGL